MKIIRILTTIAVLTISSQSASAEEIGEKVPCDKLPVTLNLPGVSPHECITSSVTAADLAKAKKDLAKQGMESDFLEMYIAPDATTHMLIYSTPKDAAVSKFGIVLLAMAHPNHGLNKIPLREFITTIVTGFNIMGGHFDFDWRTSGKEGAYDTQRYIETTSSSMFGTGFTWTCVAFGLYGDKSVSGTGDKSIARTHKSRLLGYHCEKGDVELSDWTVTAFFKALSLKNHSVAAGQ